MRIVIVDDEPRHRKGLANLIGKLRPDYEINQFKNGDEALEFLKDNKVEIIITDVEMPIMSGLEFLKEYKGIGHSCKVIILSGYPNFTYAQNAISLGAFDYVLKPVDEDIVEGMLAKAEKSIEEEQESKKREMQLLDNLNNTMEVYLEREFNRWIKGELAKHKLELIKKYINDNDAGWIIVTKINNKKIYDDFEENEEEILKKIKEAITETAKFYGESMSFYLSDNKNILATIIRENREIRNIFNFYDFNNIVKLIEEKYCMNISMGISSKCNNILYEVKEFFDEAMDALLLKFYFKDYNVINLSGEKKIKKSNIIINSKYEEKLSDSIYNDNRIGAVTLIDEVFNKSMKDGYLEPKEIKDIIIRLFINLIKEVESFMTEDNYNEIIDDVINIINECENIEELKKNCNLIIIKIISLFQRWKKDKNTIIFDKYLKYIEENYRYDISLESVSEKFHFNPCYFSTMFKEKVGMTFVKYLLKLRMQKACELLLKSDKKVYEISALLGYKEAKYFNRVFKNEMKVSPDEYRRMNSTKRYRELI
ncbi:response regulator [Clostridium chromiireducens]|uniref:response regulator n=1 Tax=Clostridium chromiireducens TaxID=225345 RepID=UPI003AF4EADE